MNMVEAAILAGMNGIIERVEEVPGSLGVERLIIRVQLSHQMYLGPGQFISIENLIADDWRVAVAGHPCCPGCVTLHMPSGVKS